MREAGSPADRNMARLVEYQLQTRPRQYEALARMKSLYFRTNRDAVVSEALEDGLTELAIRPGGGGRFEGRGQAVIAETGAGKSRLIRHVLAAHPLFAGFGDPESNCAAVSVKCPGACTLRVLGIEILRATGYPIDDALENVAWVKVRERLKMLGVLVLHIDEINNLVGTINPVEDRKIRNSLKALINREDWPVVLILSGTPDCAPILRRNKALRRRLDWNWLQPLTPPADNATVAGQIGELCKAAAIEPPSADVANKLVPRLMHAAWHQFGTTVEIAIKAVTIALGSNDAQLQASHFATAYARRTGCAADENPFVVAAWRRVDTSKVATFADDGEGTDEAPQPGRPR